MPSSSSLRAMALGFALTSAAIVFGFLVVPMQSTASQPVFLPCRISNAGSALCGKFEVPEDRAERKSRTLKLTVVYFPALSGNPIDTIVPLAGGPGEGSVATMDGYFTHAEYDSLRKHHGILFVDSRGTGSSDRIECDGDWARLETYFGNDIPILSDADLRACRKALSSRTNLSRYTELDVVRDLDALREALGIRKLSLVGFSGGTLTAQEYVRRYPSRVRAVVLGGVAAPHHPALTALGRQIALDEVFRRCALDSACEHHFGDVRNSFMALLQTVRAAPVRVPIQRPGQRETVAITYSEFADRLGFMLYDVSTARYLPYIITQAAHGNWAPFGKLAFRQSYEFYTPGGVFNTLLNQSAISRGFYYSDVCAEFVPLITSNDRLRDAPSFIGNTRNDAYVNMCRIWAVSPTRPAGGRITAPTLILSNKFDPATPWFVAKSLLPNFLSVRQITNDAWGHNTRYDCLKSLFIPFLESLKYPRPTPQCMATAQEVTFANSL